MQSIATREPEQLELFDPGRWPRRPYCTDDLASGLRVRSLSSALKKSYIQANPPNLRVWSIYDVDRDHGAHAWDWANLPPPSWSASNKLNGHAHLVYGLRAPVLVDSPDMRQAPLRYLCAVESLFREKLCADSGYVGLITKNPANPLWNVLHGPRLAYDLAELAEYLPDLEKHIPKGRRKVEELGLGRNVTIFDWLRQHAYRNIRKYKGAPGIAGWNAWLSWCNNNALTRNCDLHTPLDGREVWHIAKSVAKWTWRRFDIEASDARFSALQAHRGQLGGRAKGIANEDKRASARLMAAQGMTTKSIASGLGVGLATVYRWLA
jgi:hypothetical protein